MAGVRSEDQLSHPRMQAVGADNDVGRPGGPCANITPPSSLIDGDLVVEQVLDVVGPAS